MVVKSKQDNFDRMKFIGEGGKSTRPQKLNRMVNLLLSQSMLDEVEEIVREDEVGSRSTWIRQAIREKLDREKK